VAVYCYWYLCISLVELRTAANQCHRDNSGTKLHLSLDYCYHGDNYDAFL